MQFPCRERLRKDARRRAAVDHQCIARLHESRCGTGDRRAFDGVRPASNADSGLVDERPAGRAPVSPLERSALRQFVEIASRRFGGDRKRPRQGRDAHGALVAKERQYSRVALALTQSLLSSRHRRSRQPGHHRVRYPESSAKSRKV
jgi:hypothetical protein